MRVALLELLLKFALKWNEDLYYFVQSSSETSIDL